MGVALCPCDGTLSADAYRPVVNELIAAVDLHPDRLLAPLSDRITAFAAEHRFEEAAWARDRQRALVRALERRRAWMALQAAERIEAEAHGERVVIDFGRLVSAWNGEDTPLLPSVVPDQGTDVAPSLLAQEEADLIWKWLSAGGVRLHDVSGELRTPGRPISQLDHLDDGVVELNPSAAPASSRR